jgi:hypothetical protein
VQIAVKECRPISRLLIITDAGKLNKKMARFKNVPFF